MEKPLQDKIALITGSSRGIGASVAKRYAKEGAHVILVARSIPDLEKIDDEINNLGGTATIVSADLSNPDIVDQLAINIAERYGRLDILVGNAAILGGLRPITSITNKIWDSLFAINVTANHRLIRAFDPLIQKSDAGRLIFVTSGVTKEPFRQYWGGYATTKIALECIVKTYAEELTNDNVKANLISPGMVNTDMLAEAFPGADLSVHASADEITDLFVKLARNDFTENGQIYRAQ